MIAVVAVGVGIISAAPAFSQSGYDPRDSQSVMNRLGQLENQLQTMSRFVYRGEAPIPGDAVAPANAANQPNAATIAQYDARLSDLEVQLRAMTGQIEQQEFETRRLQQQLTEMQTQLERQSQQLLEMQNQAQQQAQQTQQQQQPVQQQANEELAQDINREQQAAATDQQLTGDKATEAYQEAFAALRSGDYARAENLFQDFLRQNPRHRLAENAQYWLAETFYVRGNFERAAVQFAEAYRAFPKGEKSPDNLLKLGMSLANLNKKQDACLSFNQINREFPDAPLAIRQRADEQKTRLGC